MAIESNEVVKSVGRVFEVLELFDQHRVPMNGTEVERHLRYPQSSTLALLKSMVRLGYVSFDAINRSYYPTLRIAKMGNWLENVGVEEGNISDLVAEIGQITDQAVSVSCQNDCSMQFLDIRPGCGPLSQEVRAGDLAPLFGSVIGFAAMSTRQDDEVRRCLERVNRRIYKADQKIDLMKVRRRLSGVRQYGYAKGSDGYVSGAGVIAWPLPTRPGGRTIVLSVAGPCETIAEQEDHIIRSTKAVLNRHFNRAPQFAN